MGVSRTCAARGWPLLLGVACPLAACVIPEPTPPPCPEATALQGRQCAPVAPLAEAEVLPDWPSGDAGAGSERDAGTASPLADAGGPSQGEDAGSPPMPGTEGIPVPFWVDDHFAMSGFFPGPPATVTVEEECPGVEGTHPASVCRRITLQPGGSTFGGFYFQYPANNWGSEAGLLVAPGATRITFRAWGATGTEQVGFGAGIDNDLVHADGWHVENAPAPLSTVPTERSIDLQGVSYERVVGPFLWVISATDTRTPVTFYLDNVRWQ